MNDDRTTRQMRLSEVGPSGQEAIARSTAVVGIGEGTIVQVVYLNRAGVGRVRVSAFAEAAPFAHAGAFQHPAARSVAAGAWRALQHVRRVLEIGDS